VLDWFDISTRGNWEGTNVPHTPRPLADVASAHGLDLAEAEVRVARARRLLYEARARRVPPGLDDKILTAWNGLMIGALADGARILGEPRYRDAAARAADFVLGTMRDAQGNLQRVHRAGNDAARCLPGRLRLSRRRTGEPLRGRRRRALPPRGARARGAHPRHLPGSRWRVLLDGGTARSAGAATARGLRRRHTERQRGRGAGDGTAVISLR
jgi:hypothetical protein